MLLAAIASAVLYTQGVVNNPSGAFRPQDGATCTLTWDGKEKQPVLALDFGAPSVGGYAVITVTACSGNPQLRLAYANHPDGLGPKGCFTRETSARYLGPDFDIPVLPGNINRHEIYRIERTGTFVAPLIQGQERYVRVQLDSPGSVTIDSVEIVNAQVYSDEPRRGTFSCSDERFTRLWDISVWTCQLASFPNHDAWKCVAGRLLPRKLEQGADAGWHRTPSPCSGILKMTYEFDANPHFPQGTFTVLAGTRRVSVVQTSTNRVHTVEVPITKGERFGLDVPKESWPVIWNMCLTDAEGKVVWQSSFDKSNGLDEWEFTRTLPFTADGAKRDRLIWSGDLWWAERNLFYGFGPQSPYMPGNVKMLAFNRTPAGYTHASPYAERFVRPPDGDYGPFGSDEFAAWFIPVTADHLLFTDDRATVNSVWPDVVALVGYLKAHCRADGIFEQRKETCKHAAGLAFGSTSLHHRSYMNILLWKTFKDAAWIAEQLGHSAESKLWQADAERLALQIRKQFWDEAHGYFCLSIEQRHLGFEANALALATRFVTSAEAARIMPQLTYHGHGKFQALAARGKFEYGNTEGGLKALADHNWYQLLNPNWKGAQTVTECMGMIRSGWGDESHPDTAIAGLYSAYILGIVPTTPGFVEFTFNPPNAGENLTWAQGVIPTPHGEIRARWQKQASGLAVTLTVPKNTQATFSWGKTQRLFTAGEYQFEAK